MHHTQGIPVESFDSKLHLFFHRFDLLSQHNELCLTKAVHYTVVAVDKVVQIIHIPKTKIYRGQARDYTNQWFCDLVSTLYSVTGG